ncbi:MAG: hypothetical protein FWB95_00535 [Treponema sp.]|nr:hypothetical protein [Treponema sp.]
MKKILFLLLFVSFAFCLNAQSSGKKIPKNLDYPQPDFDKPLVSVIDSMEIEGFFRDYIKMHNLSSDSGIVFIVHLHQPGSKEWIVYGAGMLKGKGDSDTISTNIKGLDKYRYLAIESNNGKNYKYLFYTSRNDLHINILDE